MKVEIDVTKVMNQTLEAVHGPKTLFVVAYVLFVWGIAESSGMSFDQKLASWGGLTLTYAIVKFAARNIE